MDHYGFINMQKQPNKWNRFCVHSLCSGFLCVSYLIGKDWGLMDRCGEHHQGICLVCGLDGYGSWASNIINKPESLLQPSQLRSQGKAHFGETKYFISSCFPLQTHLETLVFLCWWVKKKIGSQRITVFFIKTLTYANVCRYGC